MRRGGIPGFGVATAVTVAWLSLIVLAPLAGLAAYAAFGGADAWRAATSPRALAAYRLSLSASAFAAAVNGLFGLVLAWVLVRYRFPGRALADALVDIPLALPTAVAGLAFQDLYVPRGWLGRLLVPLGLQVVFTPVAVVVVLVFVSLPFVVRAVQPVLASLDAEAEEAAMTLGASRWQVARHVVLPALVPAWLSGLALAFARAVGEYGSVIFVSGNLPFRTEIAPVLVVMQLEQYDYGSAAAIAAVLLAASFLLLGATSALLRVGGSHA